MFGPSKRKLERKFAEGKVHFQKDLERCYGGEWITLAICRLEHSVWFDGKQVERRTNSFIASGVVHEEWPGERHLRFRLFFENGLSEDGSIGSFQLKNSGL